MEFTASWSKQCATGTASSSNTDYQQASYSSVHPSAHLLQLEYFCYLLPIIPSKSTMPRAQSAYWEHVTRVADTTRKPTSQLVIRCNFCYATFRAGSATRVKEHVDEYEMAQHLREDVQVEGSSHSPSADIASVVATPAIVTNNRRITDWANSIDASTVKQLDSLIGAAFFTGGVPFRFIENSALKKFVKAMRPNFPLEAVRRAKYVSIAADASPNVNGQSVVNYIAMTPLPISFKAIYTKGNSHTADYLARTTAAQSKKSAPRKLPFDDNCWRLGKMLQQDLQI